MSLEQRLKQMLNEPESHIAGGPLDELLNQAPEEEVTQVAGLLGALRKAGKTGGAAVKDVLEPLYTPGARAAPRDEVKVTAPQPAAPLAPVAVAPAPVQSSKAPSVPLRAAPLDVATRVARERQAAIDAGSAVGKPPEKPFNLDVYDNDEFAATVDAVARSADVGYESTSIRSIYQRAINSGISEKFVDNLLGGKLDSNVGSDALAQNLAKALTVQDQSTRIINDYAGRMVRNELSVDDMLAYRQQLAFHQTLLRSMKNVQVDVARTMNVFKRVKDAGPVMRSAQARAVLEEMGGEKALIAFSNDFLDSTTQAGKNGLVEKGAFAKAREAWFYTFQSNLLNDVSTHAVNLAGNAVFGVLQPIERLLATGIGKARTMIPGTNPDRYTMEDNYAVSHGFVNMMMDGFELASRSLRKDTAVGFKADQVAPQNPLASDYWSDTPVNAFGKEIWRTPDLKDSVAAKVIDGLAFVQSVPFRALSTVDEFFGGVAARWQLHGDAWTFANKEFDRLVAAGVPETDAIVEVKRQTAQLLTDRPADMQASIEQFRKMVTFQQDLANFRDVPTGEFYWRTAQVFQNPFLKVLQPFVNTVSNIWIEGTARTPGLNLISPRFYDDWQAGGRQRDLAVSRLALGGAAMTSFSYLGMENRVTGYGPTQNEDRAALERLGWQPYSMVFGKDEISAKNLERLSQIAKVSVGDDRVYVSFARFEPLSIILATGADAADAAKFHRGGEWDEDIESMVKTGAFIAGNYVTNLPLMQGIGDLIKIGRARSEDMGDKVVQIFDGLAKQYSNFAFTGTPGVGLANSSLVAHVERVLNPARSNTMPNEPDVPYGVRAFYETLQRVRSRIPGLSDGVPPALDSIGRELESTTGSSDHWLNWQPLFTLRGSKRSEFDEMLVSLDFGINEPPKSMGGVPLSATMFNRYKQLYGQEIKLDGMNLETFVPRMLKAAEEDSAAAGDILTVGDKQKLIMGIVSKYRTLAKYRMIGDEEGSPVSGDELGLGDDRIEFPHLKALITRERTADQVYGR